MSSSQLAWRATAPGKFPDKIMIMANQPQHYTDQKTYWYMGWETFKNIMAGMPQVEAGDQDV